MSARLLRVRWGVRLVLALGVAASVAANVLHADDNPVSQAISAWPPLALLLTIELISRVPVHRRSLAVVRWAATATIATIAGWVSYWHMASVAARYGETGGAQYLLPLSVDGLVVVASVCLVELAGRIREVEQPTDETRHAVTGLAASTVDTVTTETARPRRVRSAAPRVLAASARTPDATPAALAARLGLSERTVQRHLQAASVNGHGAP